MKKPRDFDLSMVLQNAEALRYCRRELKIWALEALTHGYSEAEQEVVYWADRVNTLAARDKASKVEETK